MSAMVALAQAWSAKGIYMADTMVKVIFDESSKSFRGLRVEHSLGELPLVVCSYSLEGVSVEDKEFLATAQEAHVDLGDGRVIHRMAVIQETPRGITELICVAASPSTEIPEFAKGGWTDIPSSD